MIYHILNFLSKMSGKINQWSWHKLWKNRREGIGYRYFDRKKK